jgi:HAD superfamily hydrolase (TIGR01509 family)
MAATSILFDLGGVLERVDAAPRVESWTSGRIPSGEFWSRWLGARSVADFESGRIGPEEFGVRAVAELGLAIGPEAFLDDFRSWLAGPYAGAADLVAELRSRGFSVASFSNSNEIHWPTMERHQDAARTFDANFPSHRIGRCKPDPEAFLDVLRRWGREASQVLFLDDNEANCRGARSAGIEAERVDGVAGARAALARRGLLCAGW